MKATYRRDNMRTKRMVIFGTLFVGVLVLLVQPVRGVFSRAIYVIAPPLWELGNTASLTVSGWSGALHTKMSLAEENRLLREEIDRMKVQVLDRNLLEERVTELQGTLGRAGSDDRVEARVIAGPGRSPYDTLVIDVGAESGVQVNDRVAYVDAGIIGEIDEVYPSSAKVKLFSSPDEETAVTIGSTPTVVSGRGLGNFSAKIPQGSLVVPWEQVLILGTDLVLGVVGAVEEKPAEPFMRLYIRTPFNIADIRSVEVIKNSTKNISAPSTTKVLSKK